MFPYKNQIIALGSAAIVALAPAVASRVTATVHAAGNVQAAPKGDTLPMTADSLLAATSLFDRMYLEAVRLQLADSDSAAMPLLDSCLKLRPEAAEVYFRQAQYYDQVGNDSLASASIERAAQLQPGNDTYQESVANNYISRHDFDNAINAYESLYAHHRDRSDVLDLLIRLYNAKKDYQHMLSTIGRLEQLDGESDELTFLKMNVYEQRRDTKNAYRMLKKLTDEHPNEPSYKVMLGNWLMNHDRKPEAFKLFQAALEEDKENEFALNSMCDYYRSTGNNEAADKLRDDLLYSSKTEVKTKISMLQQAIRENEKQGGDSLPVLQIFDRTIASSPKAVDIINLKAMYMKLKNMPEDSVNMAFARALAVEPENIVARMNIIQNIWPKKKWNEVIRLSREGTQYAPEEMAFYYFLGIAYFQTDRDDEALDILKRGVGEINDKSDPDIVSDFYAIMGDILYKKHRPEEAFAAYDSCLQWKDDNVMALNNYAYYLSEERRDLKKAEQMSQKTVKAEPTNSTYLDTYAWILFLQERYDEARAYIDRALACDDDSTENTSNGPSAVVVEHAGDIYSKCGNQKRAVELWQQAIKAGGDKAALERKIKNIKDKKQ